MNQSMSWFLGGNVAQSLGENYDRYLVPTIGKLTEGWTDFALKGENLH